MQGTDSTTIPLDCKSNFGYRHLSALREGWVINVSYLHVLISKLVPALAHRHLNGIRYRKGWV
jgi:hypothetical protein